MVVDIVLTLIKKLPSSVLAQESKEALLSLSADNVLWATPNVNRYKEVGVLSFIRDCASILVWCY